MRGKSYILVVGGATASGKSKLAMELSRRVPIEIISADSMQIYRGLDIGTAKPGRDDLIRVQHHLIDLKNPDEPFSAGEYAELVRGLVPEIEARGRIPVMVGGTGLYIRVALGGIFPGPARDDRFRSSLKDEERAEKGILYRKLKEIDPESAQRVHPSDTVRVIRALEVFHLTGKPISDQQREHTFSDRPFETDYLVLDLPRPVLYARIEERVDRMMEEGLLDEVKGLLAKGYGPDLNSMKALGYREMAAHLTGATDLDQAVELLKRNTRRFAKRQLTWFRAEKGADWRSAESGDDIRKLAEELGERLESRCG